MKTILLVGGREWKQLTRNYGQLLIIALFLGAALYSIHYGNAVIDQQERTVQYILERNATEQQELIKGLDADTTTPAGMAAWINASYPSRVRFFLTYYAIDAPSRFARLSIGQRDVHAFYLPLNGQNLYLQLFKSEIANPRKLLAGNFDLSFVVIYLLPLLIISFSYHLLSDEQEKGTLPLLRIQPVPLYRVIIAKGLFWFGITIALLALVSVIAFAWSGIPGTAAASMGWWLLITASYTACWFSLLLLVNAFKRSSAFNALCSLGAWLLFLVVTPALLNLSFTDERQADPTKLTDYIRRQQGLGESRQEKVAILQRFYQLYPQYRNEDTVAATRFLEFQAYSAYVTLTDVAAKPAIDAYYQQVWNRQQKIGAFDLVNPAVNTQGLLNVLAHSGLEDAFAFRESNEAFHKELCHFCYVPLFAGRMMTKDDFRHIPIYKPSPPVAVAGNLLRGLGWLWLLAIATFGIAYYRLRFRL